MSQEQKQANGVVISLQLANAIGDYLFSQKYGEVFQLLEGLKKAQPVTMEERPSQAEMEVVEEPAEEPADKPSKK